MLTSALVSTLQHVDSPRIVRYLDGALERRTGYSAKNTVLGTFSTGGGGGRNWYQENGFYRLANEYGGGGLSHSGIAVNEQVAMQSAAFYAGVKILSEDLGSLPFWTYQRSVDGKQVEVAKTHPLFRTLKNLANPETSSGEFVETLTAHALLCGNGYARIDRRAFGTIYLWQWQPNEVSTERDKQDNLYYIHKPGNSQEKTYARKDVFHLRGFTLDGTHGDQIVYRARQVLGLTLAAQEYAGRFFANDATPGVILTRPALATGQSPWNSDTVKLIKAEWKKWHQGLSNSHEPAVLQDGVVASTITPNHEQSQLIQQRKFQVIEVARLLRVPLFKLADLDRGIQANAEQQAIEYMQALIPWVERWKRAVHRCLLTTDEQMDDRIYAEHDVKILLRADFRSQAEGFRSLLEKGVYSVNEVRRWLNMNPVDGGDSHFIQMNMATIQDVATGATLAKEETGTMPVSGVREEE